MSSLTFLRLAFLLAAFWLSSEAHGGQCDVYGIESIYKVEDNNCACTSDRSGQIRFNTGKIQVCSGGKWRALQYEIPLGSRDNPGFSCREIKANRRAPGNGVYWMTLKGNTSPFPVFCDMNAGGWTMVFKTVTGASGNVFGVYNSNTGSHEYTVRALDKTNRFIAIYKNRIVMNWADFGASEARVVLYQNGRNVKELRFNAVGTDKLNWFSEAKLTNVPWEDFKTENPKNSFSIPGLSDRYFFINKVYNGCGHDLGWLGIAARHCEWETKRPQNAILYSKLKTYTNWNTDGVLVADVMAVYLR